MIADVARLLFKLVEANQTSIDWRRGRNDIEYDLLLHSRLRVDLYKRQYILETNKMDK